MRWQCVILYSCSEALRESGYDSEEDIPEDKMPSKMRKAIETIAKFMGAKVRYLDTDEMDANGFFQNGTIYLSTHPEKAVPFVFGHEMLHNVRKMSESSYEKMKQLAISMVGEKGYNARLINEMFLYNDQEGYDTKEDFEEEAVADIIGDVINDMDLLERLAKGLSKEDGSFKDWFLGKVKSVREYFSGIDYYDRIFDNVEKKIEEVYREAREEKKLNQSRNKGARFSLDKETKQSMLERVQSWLSEENLKWAEGKSREEIFNHFGNDLQPIAVLPLGYLQYFGTGIPNNAIYSGMGYFIDHAVNHHPEEGVEEYKKIQDILDYPDDIKLDNRKAGETSLIFIKHDDKYRMEIVKDYEENGNRLVFHKTFNHRSKEPYKKLPSIKIEEPSADGITTISHLQSKPGMANSYALDGSSSANVANSSQTTKETAKKSLRSNATQEIIRRAKESDTYLKTPNGETSNLTPEQWADVRTDNFKEFFDDWENDPENASKVVDENGEPQVVYHDSFPFQPDKVGYRE